MDYFPAYELVAAPPLRGIFYSPNMRTVSARGVDCVMQHFFDAHETEAGPVMSSAMLSANTDEDEDMDEDDVVCDQEILDAGSET